MENSNRLLNRHSNQFRANFFEASSGAGLSAVPRRLVFVFAAFSFLGFLDAAYLTAEHYFQVPLPCSILDGCEEVTTSVYAIIWNVPIAMLGLLYYSFLLFLALIYLDFKNKIIILFASLLTTIGLFASAWFVYVQVFVLEALCFYCMFSAITSSVLFILGMFMLKYTKS